MTPTEKKLIRKRAELRELEALLAETEAEGREPGPAERDGSTAPA